MQITAKALCELVNGTLEGNPDVILYRPAKIEEAGEGSISFIARRKYEAYAYTTKASALLVGKDFKAEKPVSATLIRVDDVYSTVSVLLEKFSATQQTNKEIHPQSYVHPMATIGDNVSIGAFSCISEQAIIGANCTIHSQVFIGKNAQLGKNVTLYPGVKLYHDCVIGDNSIVHANAVIGGDGFGFAPQADGTFKKIPQVGNVVIGNLVEIGANTVIDRATMGSTVIKDGAKIDNLIQIAHNVEIGENTVIAAQAGIAGSAKIGKNCMLGGQAGVVGHIVIADGTKVQAQSGVSRSIKKPNTAIYGSPAFAYNDFLRSQVYFQKLPMMEKRLRELEKKVKNEK